MPRINQATREITCKLVYYGPVRSGKSTNLRYLRGRARSDHRTRLSANIPPSLDFLSLEIGPVSGFATRFQLYAVPGEAPYVATRRLILQGVDGVIFVADSQARRFDDNLASLRGLSESLDRLGQGARQIPLVVQYNKQDLPAALILSPADLADGFATEGFPGVPADALHGGGVFETFMLLSGLVLRQLA